MSKLRFWNSLVLVLLISLSFNLYSAESHTKLHLTSAKAEIKEEAKNKRKRKEPATSIETLQLLTSIDILNKNKEKVICDEQFSEIKRLLEAGANIEDPATFGKTFLEYVQEINNPHLNDLVEQLKKRKVDSPKKSQDLAELDQASVQTLLKLQKSSEDKKEGEKKIKTKKIRRKIKDITSEQKEQVKNGIPVRLEKIGDKIIQIKTIKGKITDDIYHCDAHSVDFFGFGGNGSNINQHLEQHKKGGFEKIRIPRRRIKDITHEQKEKAKSGKVIKEEKIGDKTIQMRISSEKINEGIFYCSGHPKDYYGYANGGNHLQHLEAHKKGRYEKIEKKVYIDQEQKYKAKNGIVISEKKIGDKIIRIKTNSGKICGEIYYCDGHIKDHFGFFNSDDDVKNHLSVHEKDICEILRSPRRSKNTITIEQKEKVKNGLVVISTKIGDNFIRIKTANGKGAGEVFYCDGHDVDYFGYAAHLGHINDHLLRHVNSRFIRTITRHTTEEKKEKEEKNLNVNAGSGASTQDLKYALLLNEMDLPLVDNIYHCKVLQQAGSTCGLNSIKNGMLSIAQLFAAKKRDRKDFDRFEKMILTDEPEFRKVWSELIHALEEYRKSEQARAHKMKTEFMFVEEVRHVVKHLNKINEANGISEKFNSEMITVIGHIDELSDPSKSSSWNFDDVVSIAKQITNSKKSGYVHSFIIPVNGMRHWIAVTLFRDNNGKLIYILMDSLNAIEYPEIKKLKDLLESGNSQTFFDVALKKFNENKINNLDQPIGFLQRGQINATKSIEFVYPSLKITTYNNLIRNLASVMRDTKKIFELIDQMEIKTELEFDKIKLDIATNLEKISISFINEFPNIKVIVALLKMVTLINLSEFQEFLTEFIIKDPMGKKLVDELNKLENAGVCEELKQSGTTIDELLTNIDKAIDPETFKTLLMVAAQSGTNRLVKLLLEYGANSFHEMRDHKENKDLFVNTWTALDYAINTGRKDNATIILKYAIIDQEDIMHIIRDNNDIKLFNEIFENRKGTTSEQGLSSIFEKSVRYGLFKLVKMLLKYEPKLSRYTSAAIEIAKKIGDDFKRKNTLQVLDIDISVPKEEKKAIEIFKCVKCACEFHSKVEKDAHEKKPHCIECNLIFESEYAFKNHVEVSINHQPDACPLRKSEDDQPDARSPKKLDDEIMLTCIYCDKIECICNISEGFRCLNCSKLFCECL